MSRKIDQLSQQHVDKFPKELGKISMITARKAFIEHFFNHRACYNFLKQNSATAPNINLSQRSIVDMNGNPVTESMLTEKSIGGYPSINYKPSQRVPRSMASRRNSSYSQSTFQLRTVIDMQKSWQKSRPIPIDNSFTNKNNQNRDMKRNYASQQHLPSYGQVRRNTTMAFKPPKPSQISETHKKNDRSYNSPRISMPAGSLKVSLPSPFHSVSHEESNQYPAERIHINALPNRR